MYKNTEYFFESIYQTLTIQEYFFSRVLELNKLFSLNQNKNIEKYVSSSRIFDSEIQKYLEELSNLNTTTINKIMERISLYCQIDQVKIMMEEETKKLREKFRNSIDRSYRYIDPKFKKIVIDFLNIFLEDFEIEEKKEDKEFEGIRVRFDKEFDNLKYKMIPKAIQVGKNTEEIKEEIIEKKKNRNLSFNGMENPLPVLTNSDIKLESINNLSIFRNSGKTINF